MTIPLRILILEDLASDAELVLFRLRESGFDTQWKRVETEADFLANLKPETDIILADFSLPQFDALRALQLLQEGRHDIPLIVVSGSISEEVAVECMKQGAADYIIKDRLARLGQAVMHALEDKRLKAEQQRAEEALKRQAEELKQRNDELARLYRASASLFTGSSLELDELSQNIVKTVQKEFGQANCSLIIVQPDTNQLQRLAMAGLYTDQVKLQDLTMDGPGVIPKVIRTGETINLPDVTAEPDYVRGWSEARSELSIPLKVGDRTIGAIDVQSASANAFSADDERLMTVFAERAALALEHSRLFTQTENRLENLAALRTVDMAIAGSFDIHVTLGTLLDQATKQLGVHSANVQIYDSASQTFRSTIGAEGRYSRTSQFPFRLDDNLAGRVIRSREVVVVQDLPDRSGETARAAELVQAGFDAYMGVPLIAKGLVKGVLELYQRGPIMLDSGQRNFLDLLARQAAIAIDNSQLFETLQSTNAELLMAYDETIAGWSQAMDLRDKETEGHSQRVTEMTVALATSMGFS